LRGEKKLCAFSSLSRIRSFESIMCTLYLLTNLQRRYSACKVESADIYAGAQRTGTLNDLHMGTTDRHERCETCSGTMDECPGHFGHLELAKPMFNIGFLDVVMKILQCVCFHCSRLKVDTVCFFFSTLFSLLHLYLRMYRANIVFAVETTILCRIFPPLHSLSLLRDGTLE
jgi:DNA-directed RNA polymerase beta' subunit